MRQVQCSSKEQSQLGASLQVNQEKKMGRVHSAPSYGSFVPCLPLPNPMGFKEE
jgi:hypothetical protein